MKSDQISQTAAFIAIKFYGLTRMQPYRSWFDDEIIAFYDHLVDFLPAPLHWYHTALQKKWLREFFIFSEEMLLPGDLMHIICRKYFISQQIDKLIEKGYDQMLVLGAGFDHQATVHASNGISSFEVDTPKMISLKKKFVDSAEWNSPSLYLHAIPEPAEAAPLPLMDLPELQPDRKTIIVAEGFFDYLDQTHTSLILEGLANYFTKETTLISTIFALDELSSIRKAVFLGGVTIVGEKIKLGCSRKEFETLVKASGFSNQLLNINGAKMRSHLLKPNEISLPILEGFHLTLNQKNRDCN